MGLVEEQFKEQILVGIKNREIDLIYEEPNPHIKPFPAPSVEKQIQKLESIEVDKSIHKAEEDAETFGSGEIKFSWTVDTIGCCVYPSPELLRKIVDWRKYRSRPFTLRLAMGEWQLRPYFFEAGILAIYRNDPRYRYHTDDITGSLSAHSEELLNFSDQIFIKHFGFGFDENGNRVVAVLLTDLAELTPQHQQIWEAKMLGGYYKYKLHPDFRKSILGDFYDGNSIFSAFIEEIKIINEMAMKINNLNLFKKTFEYGDKPENFGFLILPTQREFEQFAQTLDRMLSDNLNPDFFASEIEQGDLSDTEELKKIGTIRKLEIWIRKSFRFPNTKPRDEMLKIIRDIRSLRSKPSHSYTENEWRATFLDEQKKLMERAYRAVRTLRLILTNHPKARAVEIPEWLQQGQIRTF